MIICHTVYEIGLLLKRTSNFYGVEEISWKSNTWILLVLKVKSNQDRALCRIKLLPVTHVLVDTWMLTVKPIYKVWWPEIPEMDYKHTCDTFSTHFQGITNNILWFGKTISFFNQSTTHPPIFLHKAINQDVMVIMVYLNVCQCYLLSYISTWCCHLLGLKTVIPALLPLCQLLLLQNVHILNLNYVYEIRS